MGLLVYLEPQQLKAPAWVAFTACGAFGLAGLCLIAQATGATRTQNWLGVALSLALVLPGLWVAFGPGERECTVSLPFLQFVSTAVCRGAFGIGAALGVVVLVLYARHAIARQRDGLTKTPG
jgi:hypothetical protein